MTHDDRPTGRPGKDRDPDLSGAEIAIRRASRLARERARCFGIGVAVWKSGRVVIEPVAPRQDSEA